MRENTLRVPTESVIDGNRVYVYRDDDGIVEQREVETGTANWDYTEILDGLEEGELVVTSVEREGLADGVSARREVEDAE